jgi:hypothetical protein
MSDNAEIVKHHVDSFVIFWGPARITASGAKSFMISSLWKPAFRSSSTTN